MERISNPYLDPGPPPSFSEARTRRQKVRAAGMNPDYWYPVEYDHAVGRGQVVEVKFWKRSIALYRGTDGILRAIENRCAHRQLRLTLGEVQGGNLVCPYHGWCHGGSGHVVGIPHDLFGRDFPKFKVQSFPLQVRYGLIWLFPGDPELAQARKIPHIPELEGPNRWECVPIDGTWQAHHSMIIDNVSDFTHAYLHRKYKPFSDAKLTRLEAEGDKVYVSYDTKVGRGRITQLFIDQKNINTNAMDLCYEYPFQWSNTDNKIKSYCFVLPFDERTTRSFFLFLFDHFKIPFLPLRIPRQLMKLVLTAANRLHIRPLLAEDGVAVEAEQLGYERHHDAPIAELNPAVNMFQQLTIRKWEEYLQKARGQAQTMASETTESRSA